MYPFDWRTRFGYFLAWLSEVTGCFATYAAEIPVMSLIFASSWLFITIADDEITQKMKDLNNQVKISDGYMDHAELMQHFCDVIRLYSNGKEYKL